MEITFKGGFYMVRYMLGWIDRKMDELDDDKLAIPKAFSLGIIEGCIDVSVFAGLAFIIRTICEHTKN